MRAALQKIYDEVRLVDVLDSGDSAHLTLMKRPELGVTLTKLHCWTLTHYSKCVFMDADTMVVSNIDELFEREELSAAPDPGWPDCFNSGVFVFRPSKETYDQLLTFCSEKGSFDGGDQGILNSFFSNWATADISKHLPFIYNLSSIAIYSYLPAFKQYGSNAKVVHFLGRVKPWNYSYDSKTKSVHGDFQESSTLHPDFLAMWWSIFSTSVIPLLTEQGVLKPSETGCQAVSDDFNSPPLFLRNLTCNKRQTVLKKFSVDNVASSFHLFTYLINFQLSDLVCTLALSCGFCTELLFFFFFVPVFHFFDIMSIKNIRRGSSCVLNVCAPLNLMFNQQTAFSFQDAITEGVSQIRVTPSPPPISSEERKQRWEQGQADYMGEDSFENIQKKLDSFLK
ncbi:GLYG protein, partial [Atractosteus spatula]|nr:GLYG protein [Atractosteus spatula]